MEPIDVSNIFLTCNIIVSDEIKGHCDVIIEKLNKLIPMTDTKGQTKRLKKMKKKVKKVNKFAKRLK